MSFIVYMVGDEGELIKSKLKEKGYEILIGNDRFGDGIDYEMLSKCHALVPGKARITEAVLDKAPNLKIVSKFGVGMDRIDINACTARGIYAANTPTANFTSVAEHAVTLMMASAKKINQISQYLRHEYPDWNGTKKRYQAIELSGKTLSIIGFGNIGRRVAKLVSGFDMNVIAYDPYVKKETVPENIEIVDTMDEAFARADFLSVHVAGTSDTDHLINMRELKLMKPTAIIINTTRGFVINEADLIEALRTGIIAGAGLDVFTDEPIKPGNPLMFMENVVATPHNAANTPEARLRAQADCVENIVECFEGKRPRRALNNPENIR